MRVEHRRRVDADALAREDAVGHLRAPGCNALDIGVEILLVIPHDVARQADERQRAVDAVQTKPTKCLANRLRTRAREPFRFRDVRGRDTLAVVDDERAVVLRQFHQPLQHLVRRREGGVDKERAAGGEGRGGEGRGGRVGEVLTGDPGHALAHLGSDVVKPRRRATHGERRPRERQRPALGGHVVFEEHYMHGVLQWDGPKAARQSSISDFQPPEHCAVPRVGGAQRGAGSLRALYTPAAAV